MTLFQRIKSLVRPLRFEDDEQNRLANILYTTIGAVLAGLFIILAHRTLKSDFDQAPSILALSAALLISLMLVRRGRLSWASSVSLWCLLIFLDYQCIKDDGIHDIALFAFPGILVMAGLILNRGYYIIYACAALASVAVLGYLEAIGAVQNPYSNVTDSIRIVDLLAILAATAVPIQLLADSLRKSFARALENEKAMMKHAEQIRESEERLRTLFESQGEGTGIVDARERFILCNPAAESILGVPAGSLLGRSLWDFVPPDQRAVVQSQSDQRRTGIRSTYEMEIIRPDGETRNLIVTATPRFQDGQFVGTIGVFRDITEQKKLQGQLVQSQKIQSLGTLAGGIAHDFNNILSIILGYSSKLERGTVGTRDLQESVSAINHAVGRGGALVQQILTFARGTESAFEPMNVPDLVRELISMLERTFPKVISFRAVFEADLPAINADQTQIHQALLNLCVNARDALPKGGEIVIALRSEPRNNLITRFAEAANDRYLCISVSDNGMGMDEATKNQAFDPFFTTKDKGKGTGLGLSVVYGIVQSHHGFVEVDSELGRGSTFNLYLPIPPDGGMVAVRQERGREVPGGSETILIVEDEELLLELLRSQFESKGYQVMVARDGNQAVELYAQHRKEIALVFTDAGLPKMTATEEFKRLREINPSVRVVFAGGLLEPELKMELLKAGAKTFIQKPYDPRDALAIVREVLDAS